MKDIDASIKSGTASTNALLQGIKDAIGNIPGVAAVQIPAVVMVTVMAAAPN